MRKLLDTLTLGVWLAITPTVALAETYPDCASEPSDEEVEAAKGAFMAGKAAFDEADYDRAITYWSDAYRRDCTAHDLLRNLARAYELSGQKQGAIDALQAYLDRVPDTAKRDQFLRRIEKLEEQLAAEAAAPQETEPPVTTTSEPPVSDDSPVAPPPPPERGRKPIVPLIVLGAGGVIAAVGVGGLASEAGKGSDYEDQCGPDRDQCPSEAVLEEAMDWRQRQRVFGAVTLAGVGVAATGLVWYLAAPRRKPASVDARGTTLRPLIAPTGAGLHLRTVF